MYRPIEMEPELLSRSSSPSPPTNDQSICADCQEILIQPNKAITDTCAATREGRAILQSAESGCSLCKVLVRDLHRTRDGVDSCWDIFVSFMQVGSVDVPITIQTRKSGEINSYPYTRMLLLPSICYCDPSQSQELWGPGPSIQLDLSVLPSCTKDQRCMDQIFSWSKECLENHTRCNQLSGVNTVNTMPSRLLAVGLQEVKTVATAHRQDSNAPVYMTVSHRWQNRMPKLLRCNIQKLERGINISKFPQVFQDTFKLAQTLQIPYVWIDALCIVQNDEVDKASEISKMNHIYQNAVLNVGATGAADAVWAPTGTDLASDDEIRDKVGTEARYDGNNDRRLRNENLKEEGKKTNAGDYDWLASHHSPTSSSLDLEDFTTGHVHPKPLEPGLFQDRDPLLYSPLAVTIKREGKEYCRIVYDGGLITEYENSALFKRGWVLQERLLSPRMLLFGQKIVWECSELVACETFPFGFPGASSESNVRLGRVLTELNDSSKQSAQHNAWLDIVMEFSKCQLTYESDCFPALSGLAHNFKASLQDEYYAGLWKEDFIRGLCWFPDDKSSDRHSPYPDHYRAPSWSWASVKVPIGFIDPEKAFGKPGKAEYTCLGRIEEIEVIPSGTDPLGSISSARLQISGHLRKAVRQVSELRYDHLPGALNDRPGSQCDWFDTGHEGEDFDTRDLSAAYFFLLMHENASMGDRVIGIIVEPIDNDQTTWRRIGAFDHPYEPGEDWEGEDWEDARELRKRYPEFQDWDPENYERHTITII